MADLGEGPGGHGRTDAPFILVEKHIKLFPQRDEHLFSSVPGVRDHEPYDKPKREIKKAKQFCNKYLTYTPVRKANPR